MKEREGHKRSFSLTGYVSINYSQSASMASYLNGLILEVFFLNYQDFWGYEKH